jgi:hypothetical protein
MSRILMRVAVLLSTLSIPVMALDQRPAAAAAQIAPCGYVVQSSQVVSYYRSDQRTYLTGTYYGPIQINAEWGYSTTNTTNVSAQLSLEAATIGVAAEYSFTVARSEGASYTVPSGMYGRIYVQIPRWYFSVRETRRAVCGGAISTAIVNFTYRSSYGRYIAGESRSYYF